ncbi:sulfur carrier protein ThiS [Flavihumibacter sp. ZG627]|uniref:sulfur carrier protein ThiS n=1 Tax=Flavihumibacter sp. ZG627 TaxID=1463156 RepID=UPI00057CFC91|nr:sulfur carrier protein ThiS [Flavihumibacter sp. ZG627]KIC92080.1 hypothetical protein HY58_00485 [Flavihumibacter sp. ZG627]
MEILLNNQLRVINEPYTLQQLLNEVVGQTQTGIAVAVNNSVIPKADWPAHFIEHQDNVLLIKATQGG